MIIDGSKLLAYLEKEAAHYTSRARETRLDDRMTPMEKIMAETRFVITANLYSSMVAECYAGTFAIPNRAAAEKIIDMFTRGTVEIVHAGKVTTVPLELRELISPTPVLP